MGGIENKINIILATINKMSTRIERIEKKLTILKVDSTRLRAP